MSNVLLSFFTPVFAILPYPYEASGSVYNLFHTHVYLISYYKGSRLSFRLYNPNYGYNNPNYGFLFLPERAIPKSVIRVAESVIRLPAAST